MNIWKQAPFIKLIIPLLIGILLYNIGLPCNFISIVQTIFAMSFIIITAQLIFPKKLYSYRNQYFYSVLYFAAFLSFAILFSFERDPRNHERFVGKIETNEYHKYLAKISNVSEKGNNYCKTTCKLLSVKDTDGKWKKVEGKILLYLENKDSSIVPAFGNIIAINTNLQSPQKPLFNSDFDYGKFLANKDIFYQSFVGSSNWAIIDKAKGNPILNFSLNIRNKLIEILKQQLGDNDEYAVLAAMLTGYRSDLSADMIKAYNGAGAMHIMSVSGLHVGTIYILTAFIIGLIPFLRKKRIFKGLAILSFIWLFAFITGLSASVLRASIMLTFVVVGEMFDRKISTFNSLSAAAFLLLLYNPNMLFEIGFQLSFVAVIGITTLYKPICKLFYIKNKILNYIWQLMSVSIAAQIATLPFTIYYFGQFPLYFLLGNIFIVPLSGIAIYLGVATIAFSFIPFFGEFVAWIMVKCAWIMNQIAFTIETFPGAVVSNISIGFISAMILGLIIILTMFFLIKKQIRLIYPILMCCVFFAVSQNVCMNKFKNTDFMILAKDNNQYLNAAKISNNFYIFPCKSSNMKISNYFLSRIHNFIKKNDLNLIFISRKNSYRNIFVRNEFRQIKNYRYLLWEEKKNPEKMEDLPMLNLAIKTNGNQYYDDQFLEKIPAKTIITTWKSNISKKISLKKIKELKINI